MSSTKYNVWFGSLLGAAVLLLAPSASFGEVQLPNSVSRSWWAEAKNGLEAREYHVSPVAEGDQAQRSYQAPNRKHNIRTIFSGEGVTLQDRTAAGNPALVSLAFLGLGRGTHPMLSGDARPVISTVRNRVELRHQGLTEWYINKPEGLEQGFEIPRRPAGAGELTLLLEARGAVLRLTGDKILVKTATGRELEYGKLLILDADGKVVPGRLEVSGSNGLIIAMNDTEARYPLSIDPLITGTSDETLETDQGGAFFGYSVAGAGDVNNDGYDDVIVGAYSYDNGQTDEGAAFVYYGSAGGLATTGATLLEADQAGAIFGYSVAGAGDVNNDGYADIIVGAYLYDNGQVNEGAAFLYFGGFSGVNTTPAAHLEVDQAEARFGHSVSKAGNVNNDLYADIIVGAYLYDNGEENEGAAFVFFGSDTGLATVPVHLEANQAIAWFGHSVSGGGDTNGDGHPDVVVGAPLFDNGQTDEGAAFVYYGSDAGLETTASAQLEADQADAWFGVSVSVAGDVNSDGFADIIAGAYGFDNGQPQEGAAFVYHGSATGVAPTFNTQLEANQENAGFGWSVSGTGDVNGDGYDDVVVGAPYSSEVAINAGAAYVYFGSGTGVASPADVQLEKNQAGAAFGISVAGAGDVNNDGFADIIVGAWFHDNDQTDEGAAFVYHGTTTYTVTATAGANGSLDTSHRPSPQTVMHGETTSFKFDADAGYYVASVSGCGIDYLNSLGSMSTYTATTGAVTRKCEVTATFAITAPTIGTITPSSASTTVGTALTFAANYSDQNGFTDISSAQFYVGGGALYLFAQYNRGANKLYLKDDTDASWGTGCTPGTEGTLTETRGTLNCLTTTVSGSENTLTVNWNLAPTSSLGMANPALNLRNLYLGATDSKGATTGLVLKGTWSIALANVAPSLGTITPSAGTTAAGTAQAFVAVYSDGNGYTDITTAQLYVGGGAMNLYGNYDRVANKFYLIDDVNTSWGSGCTPGAAGTIVRTRGTLNCLNTTVSGGLGTVGTNLTITWNITPSADFAAATTRNLYLGVYDSKGSTTGLVPKGTWMIPTTNVAPTLGTITPSSTSSMPGTPQGFVAVYTDGNGYTDITNVQLYVGGGAMNLYSYYDRGTNKLYLKDDLTTGWGSGCTPATEGTLTMTRGVLNCLTTTVNETGNNLTVNWNITPAAGFASATARKLYLGVFDSRGAGTGLVLKGTWTISLSNAAPALLTLNPSATTTPSGTAQVFAALTSDEDGYTDIASIQFYVGAGARYLYGYYNRSANKIYLKDDLAAGFGSGCTPGTSGTLTLTRGSLDCLDSTVSGTGNNLTVNWSITPAVGASGISSATARNIYVGVIDSKGAGTGLVDMGDWTINP